MAAAVGAADSVVAAAVGTRPVTTPLVYEGLPEFPAALFYFPLPAPVEQMLAL